MSTALHRNPFHVLGATPQDGGARLLGLAEERALIADPEACQKACAQLMSPRTRLAAELAWFPGVAPRETTLALQWLDGAADATFSGELPPLADANLTAADIERTGDAVDRARAVRCIVDLAQAADRIDLQTLLRELNADRSVAGVPLVASADAIAGELDTQRRYYARVVRDMLNKLSTRELIQVMSEAVERCTEGATQRAPRLMQDLGDTYEVEAQAFVAGEAANIDRLIARARADVGRGEARVLESVDALSSVAANWTLVMKPMQVLRRTHGIDHASSGGVATRMRNLAIWLHDEGRMIEASQRINAFLRREFNSLIELSARLDEDGGRFADSKKQNDELARAINYSAEIGLIFRKRIEISQGGLAWDHRWFKLDDITAIRWGMTAAGVPVQQPRSLCIGTRQGYYTTLNLPSAKVFPEVVERLWRAVGLRIAREHALHLRQGGWIRCQNIVIEDTAITLPHHAAPRANETARLGWPEIVTRSDGDVFMIVAAANPTIWAALSYQKVDNVPVFEHLIKTALKAGQPRLSAILQSG
jgi:hypothetical protein